jgi:hypothetical protein
MDSQAPAPGQKGNLVEQGFTFVCRTNYVTHYCLYRRYVSGVGPGATYVRQAVWLGTISLAFGPNSAKRSVSPLTDPKAGRKPLFSSM